MGFSLWFGISVFADVQQLVTACPELVELDLSDCTTLTSETICIVTQLDKIEYLALSRCYGIAPSAYL